MTISLKQMKEMARQSFGKKTEGQPIEHIETVGNKGVTHERPVSSTSKNIEEEEKE